MPYLIDGNNLLGLAPDLLIKNPGARGRLIRHLASFARAKRTQVIVVFDGEPDRATGGSGMRLGDVDVIFAGRNSDADNRILRILADAPDPAGYVLVTSDRALADRARAHRTRIVTSLSFRRALREEAPAPGSGDERLTAEEVADWEAWFRDTRGTE